MPDDASSIKEPDKKITVGSASASAVKEANACMALGAGVGALGAGSALLGAVCPLCAVVSPALIGIGLARRLQLKRKAKE